MAGVAKSSPKPRQPRIIKKSLLASPFPAQKWPTVNEDCRAKLLRFFEAARGPSNEWRKHVVLGLNAVTRALEKSRLSAILLNVSADPPRLLHGVLRLARVRSVPVLCVRGLVDFVGHPGVSSLLAVGVRSTPKPPAQLSAFVQLVSQNSPSVPEAAVQPNPTPDDRVAPVKERTYSKVPKPPMPDFAELYVVADPQIPQLFSSHIELVDENALGFPEYGARDDGPAVFEKGEVGVERKAAKRTPGRGDGQTLSHFVEANVKQVFSRGRLKEKRNKLKRKQ